MMSQQRSRKAGGAAVEPARGRQSVVKASGDSMSANVQNKQPHVRSTSKSKLPKSLRYDLENALVGLCDVWFEEIKPHLVRNNIKVHVHGGAGPASGDHQRLPPGAPGCAHLDPGAAPDLCQRVTASYADCYSTQPTASKARCRRPPAAPCRPVCLPPVTSPSKLRASLLNPYQNCETKIPRKPLARRPSRLRPHPQPQPPPRHLRNWRTPRLCRTFSIITPRGNILEQTRRTQTAGPEITRRNQYKRQPKQKDKSTQTPMLWKPEPLPDWQEYLWRQELLMQELKATTPSCLRCPATTTLCPSHRKSPPPIVPLFQEDLSNIIADKNDKQLRLLFESPTRNDNPSSLNLGLAPARQRKRRDPWR
ncbi:hypothetical protein ABMA28_006967 [Loxostege sticticalis]|uniref:Uncharacterized protein n=1 Tax=Loxostege sticticalis TaxID=481309 RepID=A0ABD0TPF8_LOXSC